MKLKQKSFFEQYKNKYEVLDNDNKSKMKAISSVAGLVFFMFLMFTSKIFLNFIVIAVMIILCCGFLYWLYLIFLDIFNGRY